ncbi:MAG: trypsin-like peptidase domain-containing protein [Anaerolineae bacterium]|nr:trypsin-like peptidase domain-containing protein [Anaerolineae bacterium]
MRYKSWTMKLLLLLLVAVSLACSSILPGRDDPEPELADEVNVVEEEEAVNEPEIGEDEDTNSEAIIDTEPVESDVDRPAASLSSLREAMQQVRDATIQIETDASMTDIDGAVYAQSGTGTGFIIDESGIAVTNNHVVTGGRSWKVYVGGEGRARNAKVLGVSECSDLAVIDIEGDGFPVLDWYEGEIFTGLPVYAAGYPLGDPEFTLTRGIVSKEEANGQTSWASVDGVIEHDATINPGNSGGPLVTEDGKVVAVNYANLDSQEQGHSILFFAIARDEARNIIDRLREGEDFLAIGVNGQAFVSESGDSSGIWVQSVQSGSVADEARIEGGDIITSLEGRELAVEGTMREYCDTLRSHDPDDTLDVEVVRFATGEILEGQLNGRELEMVEEFDVSKLFNDGSDNILGPGSTSNYMVVTDNYRAFEVEIPAAWTDIDGRPLLDDDGLEFAAALYAADTQQGDSSIQMSVFSSPPDFDPASFLDSLYPSDLITNCSPLQRFDYNDHEGYNGVLDFYENCGKAKGTVLFIVLRSVNAQEFGIYLNGINLGRKDMEHLFDTFQLVGPLP